MSTIHRDLLSLLRRAGVDVRGGARDGDHGVDLLLLTPDDALRPTHVKSFPGQLSTADLRRSLHHHRSAHPGGRQEFLLLGTDSASQSALAGAAAGEYDLVTTTPPLVIIGGRVYLPEGRPRDPHRDRRRVRWQQLAVQRVLAVCEQPMTQAELIDATGASQQAVSAATRTLAHITRSPNRGPGTDRHRWSGTSELLDDWHDDYPGPRGLEEHWYGLDAPALQYQAATGLLTELEVWSVLSGDLAADRYSAWMMPSSVRLYIGDLVDFTDAGFSRTDAADATLTVVKPEDRSLLPAARYRAAELDPAERAPQLLADPAMIWWDLLHTSPDPRAVEAARHVRASIERERAA